VATVDRPAATLALSLANLHPAEPLERVIWVPGRTGPAVDAAGRLARARPRRPERSPGAEPARTTTLQELHRIGSMVIAPSVTPAA
jgi:hypothetical protein